MRPDKPQNNPYTVDDHTMWMCGGYNICKGGDVRGTLDCVPLSDQVSTSEYSSFCLLLTLLDPYTVLYLHCNVYTPMHPSGYCLDTQDKPTTLLFHWNSTVLQEGNKIGFPKSILLHYQWIQSLFRQTWERLITHQHKSCRSNSY